MTMRSEYHTEVSPCCGATLHRPAGDRGPWFCMDCGAIGREVRAADRARFSVAEHHSGMFAVIDNRTGDTVHLYADEQSAQRVAARGSA